MNSANFKTVKSYTKSFLRGFLFAFFYFAQVKVSAFDIPIDMSRRQPASVPSAASVVTETPVKTPSKNLFAMPVKTFETSSEFTPRQNDAEILKALKKAMLPADPSNEIVILNTETGFIPAKVQLRKGEAYKIHVVNLNMREKNTSFLMDAFTQSHNTVFGLQKTFHIEPQVEGVFSFQCPETGIQGQVVVVQAATDNRKPASSVSDASDREH